MAEKYTPQNIRRFVDDSLKNLELQTLDLLQLHCPPTAVYYTPELFAALDEMVKAGKLRNYGVSVEKVEEALKAIEYPGVKTVQIIFNMFRQRPAELFFREARARRIGILARVPLASGLLTGKMTRTSRFARDDHRNYNRKGQAFDRGETFSGVDYEKGLKAVEELKTAPAHGLQHAPVRPALDPDARRGHLRHPRGQAPGAGGGQLRRLRPAPAVRKADAAGPGRLRQVRAGGRAPALVGPRLEKPAWPRYIE